MKFVRVEKRNFQCFGQQLAYRGFSGTGDTTDNDNHFWATEIIGSTNE